MTVQTVIRWLQEFERRLGYSAPPVRDWLRESVASPQYAELHFLEETLRRMQETDLKTAWSEALTTTSCWLGAEEITLLQLYGQQLGAGDVHTQLHCIRETVSALEQRCEVLRAASSRADRLYVTLGVSGGLAAAIVLM